MMKAIYLYKHLPITCTWSPKSTERSSVQSTYQHLYVFNEKCKQKTEMMAVQWWCLLTGRFNFPSSLTIPVDSISDVASLYTAVISIPSEKTSLSCEAGPANIPGPQKLTSGCRNLAVLASAAVSKFWNNCYKRSHWQRWYSDCS